MAFSSIKEAQQGALRYYAKQLQVDVDELETVKTHRIPRRLPVHIDLGWDCTYDVVQKTTGERVGSVLIGYRSGIHGMKCWPVNDTGGASPIEINLH